ncbi:MULTISPECIES: hypothetical protein [unclassified Gordonia (in: high G+C Gram-positive bacteria)]
MSMEQIDAELAASLRKIERSVLSEVRFGRVPTLVIIGAVTVLIGACFGAWVGAPVRTGLVIAAVAVGAAAAAVGTVALIRPRFCWCWTAGVLSGLGVPVSMAGYWSAQTVVGGHPCPWLLALLAAHIALVSQWVRCAKPVLPASR